jgi:hypothetical protein
VQSTRGAVSSKGNPACLLYYVTTGKVVGDASLAARAAKVKEELASLEYFSEVEVTLIGAADILKLYTFSKNAISGSLHSPADRTFPRFRA